MKRPRDALKTTATNNHLSDGLRSAILSGTATQDMIHYMVRFMLRNDNLLHLARTMDWRESPALASLAESAMQTERSRRRELVKKQYDLASYTKTHRLPIRLWIHRGSGSRTLSLGFVRITNVSSKGLSLESTDTIQSPLVPTTVTKKTMLSSLYGHAMGRATNLEIHRSMAEVDHTVIEIVHMILKSGALFKACRRPYEYRLSVRGSSIAISCRTNVRTLQTHPMLCAHLLPEIVAIIDGYDYE